MAYYHLVGFEQNSVADGVEIANVTGGGAGATISSSVKRTGSYSFRSAPSSASASAAIAFSNSNIGGEVRALIWFRIDSHHPVSSPISFVSLTLANDTRVLTVGISNVGLLTLHNGTTPAATQIGSSYGLTNPADGLWHSMYIAATPGTVGNASVEIEIDGNAWINSTGLSFSNSTWARLRFGHIDGAPASGEMFFDDIRIADSGTNLKANRLAGVIDIPVDADADTSLRGAGQGTSWDTGPSTGGTAWQQIDEVPTPNDATDYVALMATSAGSASATILDFGLADPASQGMGASDTVLALAVQYRHVSASSANKNDLLRLKSQSGGTVTESSTQTYGSTTWRTNTTNANNVPRLISVSDPQDGSPWTRAKIAAGVVGVRSGDVSPNPWISKIWVTVLFEAAGGTTYTLTADASAVALSGQASTLKFDRKVSADAGSLALTPQAATLARTLRFAADGSTFSLSPQTASLLKHSKVLADAGIVALTPEAAALLKSARMNADQGSVVITAQAVDFSISKRLNAEAGELTLSGAVASLLLNRLLSSQIAEVTLTSQSVNFLRSRVLTANSGALALTGEAAVLLSYRKIVTQALAIVIQAQEAALSEVSSNTLLAETGIISISQQSASLFTHRKVEADSAAVALGGQAANLLLNQKLVADPLSLVATAQAVEFLRSRTLVADSNALALNGEALSLLFHRILIAGIGTAVITPVAATGGIEGALEPSYGERYFTVPYEQRDFEVPLEQREFEVQ